MKICEIPPKTPTNQLGDLAMFLYDEVLIPCESDIKQSFLAADSKKYKQFQKEHSVSLKWESGKEKKRTFTKYVKYNGKKRLYLQLNIYNEDITDKIIFVSNGNTFKSLFSHIRNAFAHNQIWLNGSYVTLCDTLQNKRKNLTMVAHVKIEELKELIKCLKI